MHKHRPCPKSATARGRDTPQKFCEVNIRDGFVFVLLEQEILPANFYVRHASCVLVYNRPYLPVMGFLLGAQQSQNNGITQVGLRPWLRETAEF